MAFEMGQKLQPVGAVAQLGDGGALDGPLQGTLARMACGGNTHRQSPDESSHLR